MKALPGYVIVLPTKDNEEQTSTGLYIKASKDRPVKGSVVSVGGQTATEGPSVKVGDIIYHRRWSGDEIKEDGISYRIVKFSDCIALYENK